MSKVFEEPRKFAEIGRPLRIRLDGDHVDLERQLSDFLMVPNFERRFSQTPHEQFDEACFVWRVGRTFMLASG